MATEAVLRDEERSAFRIQAMEAAVDQFRGEREAAVKWLGQVTGLPRDQINQQIAARLAREKGRPPCS